MFSGFVVKKQIPVVGLLGVLSLEMFIQSAGAQPFRPDAFPAAPPSSAVAPPGPAGENGNTQDAGVYFGITADTVQRGRGAEVLAVDPGGPADRAGIRTGDIIERCNGQATPTVNLLGKAIAGLKVGEEIPLAVRRGGILVELKLTPSARPAAQTPSPLPAPPLLGVVALAVDPIAAARAGLPIRTGAVVDAVVPNSPAAAARVPIGAIIVGLDDVGIDSPDQLRKVVAARQPGDLIRLHYYEGLRLREVQLRLAARETPESRLRPSLSDREEMVEELRILRQELQRIEQRIRQLEAGLKN